MISWVNCPNLVDIVVRRIWNWKVMGSTVYGAHTMGMGAHLQSLHITLFLILCGTCGTSKECKTVKRYQCWSLVPTIFTCQAECDICKIFDTNVCPNMFEPTKLIRTDVQINICMKNIQIFKYICHTLCQSTPLHPHGRAHVRPKDSKEFYCLTALICFHITVCLGLVS